MARVKKGAPPPAVLLLGPKPTTAAA